MKGIKIRIPKLTDIGNITVLLQQVWIATYAKEGIRNELSEYVLSEFTIENIQKIIFDKNKRIFIAEIDNHIIGYVELEFNAKCPILTDATTEISKLYVLDKYHGKNIGKTLLENAFLFLRTKQIFSVWLTVFYKNEMAIKFYEKYNFKNLGNTYFEMSGNQYKNKVMICKIKELIIK